MSKPPENLDPNESSGVAVQEAPPIRRPVARPSLKSQPAVPRVPRAPVQEEEEDSFFVRNKVLLIAAPIIVGAVVWFAFFHKSGPSQPVHKAPEAKMVMVQLPPPPAPPPPPPKIKPPEPPKDDKRPEQAPTEKPADKPVEKPAEKPPEGLGTNNKGPGPGMAGLGSSGNGMIGGTGTGSGGGGNAARWYAQQLQARLIKALSDNPKTKKAVGRVDVRLWIDPSGKVMRSELVAASGNAEVDAALKSEILANLRGPEAPPKNLKQPITYRVDLKRRP